MQLYSSTSFEKEKGGSEPFEVKKGKGEQLRDLEAVEHRISLTRTTAPALILLHRVLFPHHKAHPNKHVIKGHCRDFSGWTEEGSEAEARKRLEKKEVKDLKALATILDVSGSGSKAQLIEHIVDFCNAPAGGGHASKSKKGSGGGGTKRASGGGSGKKGSAKKGGKKGGKAAKKKRGSTGPNPYILFVKERRAQGEGEHMSVADFGKKMGEEWRAMDDDDKEKYRKEAAALRGEAGKGEEEDEEEGEGDEEEDEGEEGEEEEGEEGEGEQEDGGDEEAKGDDSDKQKQKKQTQTKGSKKKGAKKAGGDDEDGEGKEEEGEDGAEGEAEGEEEEEEVSEEHRSLLERLGASISAMIKGADLESLTTKKIKEKLSLEHGEEVIQRFGDRIKRMITKAIQ